MAAALVALGALTGCGDDGDDRDPDGPAGNARLILISPGDTVGLQYNETITLGIRYENRDGFATGGIPVEFALVATSEREDSAGSTLSATGTFTDRDGVAEIELVAGAAEGTFRVSVEAPDAPTAFFHVNISQGGFVQLLIKPIHEGWRDADQIPRVQVRIYRAEAFTCAALSAALDLSFRIEDLPDSLAPPRVLDGFGDAVSYLNVNAGKSHAVIGWSELVLDDDGTSEDDEPEGTRPIGIGCVDLGPGQLPTGGVQLDLVVPDRDLALDRVMLTSTFDLTPVAAALAERGTESLWQVMACPAGPGQLALDCALDAAAPDDDLDCQATGSSALVDAVAAQRGEPDSAGCRPTTLPGDQASLDQLLTDAIITGASFPAGDSLTALLAVRSGLIDSFTVTSELTGLSSRASSHRLLDVTVGAMLGPKGRGVTSDLGLTRRPVIEQRPVGLAIDGSDVTLAEHAFTLRYGELADAGFTELGLAPVGLDGASRALGTALAGSVSDDGSGQNGCAGLSALVCSTITQPETCLMTACQQGATALDGHLTAWWRALENPGLDFAIMNGAAPTYDRDGDLLIDALGAADENGGDIPGIWSATLRLSDDDEVVITGDF